MLKFIRIRRDLSKFIRKRNIQGKAELPEYSQFVRWHLEVVLQYYWQNQHEKYYSGLKWIHWCTHSKDLVTNIQTFLIGKYRYIIYIHM